MNNVRIQRQALPAPAFAAPQATHVARPLAPVRGQSLAEMRVQPKLSISDPDDFHEREADRVADEILRMPEPGAGLMIQRMCTECAEERKQMQTSPDTTLQRLCTDCDEDPEDAMQLKRLPGESPASATVAPLPSGGGRAMTAAERSFFEPRYGADFGAVRIHSGAEAAAKAAHYRARAFTIGSNIVLGSGQGSAATAEGRRLMAHELTHVVQQGAAGISRLDRVRITPLRSPHVQRAVGDSCYISVPQGPYANALVDNLAIVGAYQKFTKAQRAQILAANAANSVSGPLALNVQSEYDSDESGGALIPDTAVCNVLARVDHTYPRAGGGCNSVRNAQVISADENLAKSNNYPWASGATNYYGKRVLDPTTGAVYPSKPNAVANGANNAAALP